MKLIYSTLLLLLIFQGCGETDGTDTEVTQKAQVIEMEPNKNYTVYTGDKIIKTTDDAQISILKNTQDETSSVTLIQGSANIIRK